MRLLTSQEYHDAPVNTQVTGDGRFVFLKQDENFWVNLAAKRVIPRTDLEMGGTWRTVLE